MGHTPTPRRIEKDAPKYCINALERRNVAVVSCYRKKSGDEQENEYNAEFIVRAVNCHDEFVYSLESIVEHGEGACDCLDMEHCNCEMVRIEKEALKKAGA